MNIKRKIITMSVVLLTGVVSINAQEMKTTEVPKISAFPTGNENAGFEKYFTGKSWLAPLTGNKDLNVPMFNVTFEPGCRNNWHSHTGGQILIAVGGVGYYQERGKTAQRLLPGDVVEIAPDVEHWHGAAPDSWFSHIAVECNPQANKNTWYEPVNEEEYAKAVGALKSPSQSTSNNTNDRIEICKKNYTELFGGEALTGQGTDPEMMDILQKFIFGEVFRAGNLDKKTREMITCVTLTTMQTLPQLKSHAGAALNVGVTPVELRELVYLCAPFIGFPRTLNALATINEVFKERNISLPLEEQGTVTESNRYEKGAAIQYPLYGDEIEEVLKDVPGGLGSETARFLTEFGFGDIYTRNGLDVQTRELLIYCVLTTLGADSQLVSHGLSNIKLGNSREKLATAVVQCLPYIGFPPAIKALKIIKSLDE